MDTYEKVLWNTWNVFLFCFNIRVCGASVVTVFGCVRGVS